MLPGGTRLDELITAQRLAGGSGRVERIGLGAVTVSGPFGPVQLHHLLSVTMQEVGQAGAVAERVQAPVGQEHARWASVRRSPPEAGPDAPAAKACLNGLA
jgi:hypothetical protein